MNTKHWQRMIGVALTTGLLLAACAPAATPTTAPPTAAPATAVPTTAPGAPLQSIGEGEGAVSIVAWAGYIERGETDPAYDWVTDFEAATGCMVSVKTAATSDEMVALMNEGGFDLVTASGDASNRLISGRRVQEINVDLLPSWSTVDERLQSAPWNTVEGKHYGVPYVWGPNVLMYSTEAFGDTPPTSWSVVFEEMTLPDGESNAGRVQAYDGPIYIADAALYLMYTQPELGITDPYALNREQFNAALDLLRQQRELVSRYWHDAFIHSLVIIVLNTLVGFAGYASHVEVDYALVGSIALAAILGSFAGSRLADRIDPGSLRRAFAGFVLVMATVIFVHETDTWLATASNAVPRSIPQVAFVLFVLGVGIAAGRVSRRGGADPLGERAFTEGAGI